MKDSIYVKAFVEACDHDQAAFLNEVGRCLHLVCKTNSAHENQLCWMADKLDKDGQAFVKALAEFVDLKNKE